MIKKLQTFFMTMFLAGAVLFPALTPAAVMASNHTPPASDTKKDLCAGINLDPNDQDCKAADADNTIKKVLTTVINLFSLVVGFTAVLMIIVGGFKYITAGGDTGNVTAAKNTILYAVIGLVIVALAQFIVRFVLGRVTG